MRCPSCGFENSEEMHFCIECASPLKHDCPSCGFENPPQAKFCGKCATPLTQEQKGKRRTGQKGKRAKERQPIRTLDPRPQTLDSSEAERRQLTVMFCPGSSV
jgi:hypothetical protein